MVAVQSELRVRFLFVNKLFLRISSFQEKAVKAADAAKRKRQTLAEAGGAPPPPSRQGLTMVLNKDGKMVLDESKLVSYFSKRSLSGGKCVCVLRGGSRSCWVGR